MHQQRVPEAAQPTCPARGSSSRGSQPASHWPRHLQLKGPVGPNSVDASSKLSRALGPTWPPSRNPPPHTLITLASPIPTPRGNITRTHSFTHPLVHTHTTPTLTPQHTSPRQQAQHAHPPEQPLVNSNTPTTSTKLLTTSPNNTQNAATPLPPHRHQPTTPPIRPLCFSTPPRCPLHRTPGPPGSHPGTAPHHS